MTPPLALRPELTDHQLLAALPSAVDCAQRFLRYTLQQWQLHSLIDTAEVVVAVLVSDAVAATGIVIEHPGYLDLYDKHLNLVDLRLQLIGTRVLIKLWDAHPTPPWPRESDARTAADLMRSASGIRSWNYYLPPTGGKVVRVELEIPLTGSLEDTQELALPKRAGYPHRTVPPAPTRPIDVMTDLVLLQRVLNGLRQLDTDDSTSHDEPRSL